MSEDASRRRGRLRRLSAEEIELWLAVAAGVARRPGAALPAPAPLAVTGVPAPVVPPSPPPQAQPTGPAALPPLAPIERKLKQRLARGKMTADAAIDLHGLTRERALGALRRFLFEAQDDGMRVVLVVTGKGGSPKGSSQKGIRAAPEAPFDYGDGVGVLKRSVPLWLDMPEFRPLVIGYEEAGRSHGGAGALYVRIRRRG